MQGFFGAPGLHWAAINGHKKIIEFLIANGADLGLRDEHFNSTALNWALEANQTGIAELLRRNGVEEGSPPGDGEANHTA